MNVMILGSGGREHALAWKLSLSPRVTRVYVAPGNAGIGLVDKTECVPLDLGNMPGVIRWARDHDVSLLVPGSESALVDGAVDLAREAGIRAFGPSRQAAELERSKTFAKQLMRRHGIPTADFAAFEQYEPALRYLDSREEGPVVVKADGLAAGKGAIVCDNLAEARDALARCFVKKEFGEAGERVVIEEFMRGEEVSVLALTDGRAIAPLASAQDHKAVFDGDSGPNTGGMGAYSPAPVLTEALLDDVVRRILVPTVHAMNEEGRRFRGVLYAGLMITGGGPKVVEFNVRFGDPETQPILMRLENDLLELLEAVVDGKLERQELRWRPEASVCVVMASEGYPGPYRKGDAIEGLERSARRADTMVFHAGTAMDPDGHTIRTSGGRVLGVTALGRDIPAAIARAYEAVDDIRWPGMHCRKDIGQKALRR